jgi:hypothetical protein
MKSPEINVKLVRSLMSVIFEAFDGVELKDLGDDTKENTALAVAIITFLSRHMAEDSVNYIPTAIEFAQTIQFANVESKGEIVETPLIKPEVIESYIEDIGEAIGTVAIKINETVPKQQDAYLILSLLHFALFILLTTFNLTTARSVVSNYLVRHQY